MLVVTEVCSVAFCEVGLGALDYIGNTLSKKQHNVMDCGDLLLLLSQLLPYNCGI